MPLSNIKVLLLNVNREGWHSGNMIYDMRAIQYACDTKLYGPGHPDYISNDLTEIVRQLYGNDKPDVIYSYFTPNERVRDVYQKHYKIPEKLMNFPINLDKIDCLKIFALSDFWARSPDKFEKDLLDSTFMYCFACFAPPYSVPYDFYSFFKGSVRNQIKFIGYPRCIDKDCFKDYNLPKKYDAITLGAMGNFYPRRTTMHHELANNASSNGIKYHNYPHCGFDFTHSDFTRENYAKAINESKILLSCGGKYHVAMNKIFESMACGTLYMGETPMGYEELHLKHDYNYVDIGSNGFIHTIKDYLNNESKMNFIINNAKETFLKYHTIEARAADFVKLLRDAS